jgi:hypothetical protein
MAAEFQYALSVACGSKSAGDAGLAVARWVELVPQLLDWSRLESHGKTLASAMPSILADAQSAYDIHKLAVGTSRQDRLVAQLLESTPTLDRVVVARNRDNNLAREVAIRAASQATNSFIESVASTPGRDVEPEGTPATPLPPSPLPADTAVSVRSSKRRRIAVANATMSPRTLSRHWEDVVSPSREPLAQVDPNILGPLSFAATTRIGRVRTITEKGRSYFNT